MVNTYQYVNPKTDEVVEATTHEYATRYKGMGFVLVAPEYVKELQPTETPEEQTNTGKPQVPVQSEEPEVDDVRG